LQLGDDPLTGSNRGVVQFATAPLALSASNSGPEWLARLDHNLSEAHRLTFRYARNPFGLGAVPLALPYRES
jgi:hypothetical protein